MNSIPAPYSKWDPIIQKLDNIFSKYPQVTYKAESIVIRSSDEIKYIYYIEKGSIKQTLINEDGERITITIFSKGAYFPVMLALVKVDNEYAFEVVEDGTTVRKAPVEEAIQAIESDNELLVDLVKRFANGINGIVRRLHNLMFADTYGKVVSFLLYFASKYGENTDDGVLISLSITHDDIDSWLGIQRETVTRQINKLKEEGFIEYRNKKILIKNIEKLRTRVYKSQRAKI